MNKQIIQRNLSHSDRYKLVSIQRQFLSDEDVSVTICDNCDKEIINVATIANSGGKWFKVGLDCLKTLTQSLAQLDDAQLEIMSFNSALNFWLQLERAEHYSNRNGFITAYYKDKKHESKSKVMMEQILEHYNFPVKNYPSTKTDLIVIDTMKELGNGKTLRYRDGNYLMEITQVVPTKFKAFRDSRTQNHLERDAMELRIERLVSNGIDWQLV